MPIRPGHLELSWALTLFQAPASPAVAISQWGEVPRSDFRQHLQSTSSKQPEGPPGLGPAPRGAGARSAWGRGSLRMGPRPQLLTSSLLCSTSGMGSCGASKAPSFCKTSLGSSPQAWQ